jgi:hypothetical protein
MAITERGINSMGVTETGITDASARPVVADTPVRRWLTRFAWLALFWILGVGIMGLVAGVLRALMHAVGLGR